MSCSEKITTAGGPSSAETDEAVAAAAAVAASAVPEVRFDAAAGDRPSAESPPPPTRSHQNGGQAFRSTDVVHLEEPGDQNDRVWYDLCDGDDEDLVADRATDHNQGHGDRYDPSGDTVDDAEDDDDDDDWYDCSDDDDDDDDLIADRTADDDGSRGDRYSRSDCPVDVDDDWYDYNDDDGNLIVNRYSRSECSVDHDHDHDHDHKDDDWYDCSEDDAAHDDGDGYIIADRTFDACGDCCVCDDRLVAQCGRDEAEDLYDHFFPEYEADSDDPDGQRYYDEYRPGDDDLLCSGEDGPVLSDDEQPTDTEYDAEEEVEVTVGPDAEDPEEEVEATGPDVGPRVRRRSDARRTLPETSPDPFKSSTKTARSPVVSSPVRRSPLDTGLNKSNDTLCD